MKHLVLLLYRDLGSNEILILKYRKTVFKGCGGSFTTTINFLKVEMTLLLEFPKKIHFFNISFDFYYQ